MYHLWISVTLSLRVKLLSTHQEIRSAKFQHTYPPSTPICYISVCQQNSLNHSRFFWYPPQVKNSLISFIYSLLLSWSPLIVQITKKWIWRRNENVVCDVIEKTTIKSTARKKIVNLLTRKYSAKHFYFKKHNHEKNFMQSQSVPPNTFNKRTLSCA